MPLPKACAQGTRAGLAATFSQRFCNHPNQDPHRHFMSPKEQVLLYTASCFDTSTSALKRLGIFMLAVAGISLPLASEAFMAIEVYDTKSTTVESENDAPDGAYPWMASLQKEGNHFCGATLIAPEWVLTAATCITEPEIGGMENLSVLIGHHNLDTPIRIVHEVASIHTHPEWRGDAKQGNDIALLRLATPASSPAVVLAPSPLSSPAEVVTIGWGDKGPHHNNGGLRVGSHLTLQHAFLPVASREACVDTYGASLPVAVICAGHAEGGKDSCQGDAGGPIVTKIGEEWQQVGLISWGQGCGQPGYYGVHTDVAHFGSWIRNEIASAPALSAGGENSKPVRRLGRVQESKIWVLYSSQPGTVSYQVHDSNDTGVFAYSLRKVAESTTTPIASLAELHDRLVDEMEVRSNILGQRPELKSSRLAVPICPVTGPLRIRIIAIDVEQPTRISVKGDVEAQQAAWRKLCPDTSFSVHAEKVGKMEIGAILESALDDARHPSGASLLVVSGGGGNIDGNDRFLLSGGSLSNKEDYVANSMSISDLLARIDAACQTRCGVMVDAGRRPLYTGPR
jgi:secreted trypsin-like serine protease